jgi:hypothetical protein
MQAPFIVDCNWDLLNFRKHPTRIDMHMQTSNFGNFGKFINFCLITIYLCRRHRIVNCNWFRCVIFEKVQQDSKFESVKLKFVGCFMSWNSKIENDSVN